MNQPLHSGFDADGRVVARVQAGLSFAELSGYVNRKIPGYRFLPNPTETSAALGGAFAVNAKGPNALRYGGTGGYIEGLAWITPQGEVWEIERGRYRFDVKGCQLPDGSRLEIDAVIPRGASAFLYPFAGLDLVDFLSGSEGLIGVAAELTLRLEPLPAAAWAVVYFFTEADKAPGFAEALSRWRKDSPRGQYLSQVEYYDEASLCLIRQGHSAALQRFPPIRDGYRAAVHVELEGDDAESLESALAEHLALFAESGGGDDDTWAAADRTEVEKYRILRHSAPELINMEIDRIRRNLPEFRKTAADFMVPPEKAVSWNARYHRDIAEARVRGFVFGHILEGRLHVNLLGEDAEAFRRCQTLLETWSAAVLEDGGLLAAENGAGRLKARLLSRFLSSERLDQIRHIIRRLDPQGLLGGADRFQVNNP
jgi:D-lactate dehydrogenase (cytochrome)